MVTEIHEIYQATDQPLNSYYQADIYIFPPPPHTHTHTQKYTFGTYFVHTVLLNVQRNKK